MERRYLKMLQGMKESALDADRSWSVYIVSCADGTLYTGISNDIERRLKQHNDARGAAYTRSRRPVTLVYREPGMTRAQALVREAAVKRLPKPKKERLIAEIKSY